MEEETRDIIITALIKRNSMSIFEISSLCNVPSGTVTTVVNSLENEGYVKVWRDDADEDVIVTATGTLIKTGKI